MKRIFLIAGEASGDLHGSILVRALRAARGDLEFWGVGGARLEREGVRLIRRSEELAVVGLFEVIERLPKVLGALQEVQSALGELRPDLLVPIDFPDFNFRLLPRAFRLNIPVVYYISPQIWAWRADRIDVLRRFLRRMVVIFPFEEAIYRKAGIDVRWIGHPLADLVPPAGDPEEERRRLGLEADGPAVALLPGSRRSEVARIAPLLRSTAEAIDRMRRSASLPAVRWIGGLAPGLTPEEVGLGTCERWLPGIDALRASELALVASGTTTLEATLLGRPVVVTYRMHPLTYWLARRSVRVEHIAMANLLAGRRLVPEFVQAAARPEALAEQAQRWLDDPEQRLEVARALLRVRESLGSPGAAARGAAAVLEVLDAA